MNDLGNQIIQGIVQGADFFATTRILRNAQNLQITAENKAYNADADQGPIQRPIAHGPRGLPSDIVDRLARFPRNVARGARIVSDFINRQFNPASNPIHATTSSTTMPHTRRGIHFSFQKKRKRRRMNGNFTAKLALKKVRRLERKVEVKTFDVAINNVAVPATGAFRSLADIAQGDTSITRDGNAVAPFRLHLSFNWIGVIAMRSAIMRCIIFRDMKQEDSTVPTLLNVLTTVDPTSLYNRLQRKRWKVLYDRSWTATQSNTDAFMAIGFINMKLRLPLKFSGAAATSHLENGLYMILVSNQAIDIPSFRYTSRLFFNDS